ncbi:PEP-CTERM sorting domain-containing protein [Pacificimonas sp. ICDLI1SI03]
MRTSLSLALIAGTALGMASAATANHVDFIQDDSDPSNGIMNANFSLTSNGATVTDTQTGEPADILGGTRTATLTRRGFGGSASAENAAGSDVIEVRNGNVANSLLQLDYFGFENSNFAAAYDSVAVNIDRLFMSSGIGDAEVEIGVTFYSGVTMETVTATRLEASLNGGPQSVFFNFSDYSSIDFTDIDGLSVIFDSKIIGTDFDIASITRELVNAPPPADVPAPAAVVLFGLGLAGVGAFRRRRTG